MASRGMYRVNDPGSDRSAIMWKEDFWLVPKVKTSLWLWLGAATLLASNILYLTAFVTNGWGRLTYTDLDPNNQTVTYTIDFGLWIACRQPDGLCRASFPEFYGTVRAFSVLALFGHVFALALLVGHSLEKLLDYDPCGLSLLTAISFLTSFFCLVLVSVFGSMWQNYYRDYKVGISARPTSIQLRFSFIITCVIIILPAIAGVMCIIEIRQSLVRLIHRKIREEEIVEAEPSTSGLKSSGRPQSV